MRLVLILLFALAAASAGADEKVRDTEGQVAPGAETGRQAARSEARKQEADWIKRCDKVAKDARMQCLDEVRAQMVQQLEQDSGPAKAAAR